MALNGTVPCVPSSASSKTRYVIIAASQRGTHTSPDLRHLPMLAPSANLDGFFYIWRQLCSSSILHLWTHGQAGSLLGWWMPWTKNNRYIRRPSKCPYANRRVGCSDWLWWVNKSWRSKTKIIMEMFMKSRLRNLKEFVMKKANVDSVQKQQRDWGTVLQPSRVTKHRTWSQQGLTASTNSCDIRVNKPFCISVPYSFASPCHPLLSLSGILLPLYSQRRLPFLFRPSLNRHLIKPLFYKFK